MKDIDIFNIIKEGLLKQNDRSEILNPESGTYSCAYHGEGGKKCAVGMIIDNGNYSPKLEFKPVTNSKVNLAIQNSNPYWKILYSGEQMLLELQNMHDGQYPGAWADYMSMFRFYENGYFNDSLTKINLENWRNRV